MTLTPQSVREKQFTPTRFKTGYDEDEVDAFLDEVEAELARLHEENESLRRALAAGPAADPAVVPVSAPEGPPPAPLRELDISTPGTPGQAELEEMLRRTLLLAQRTADEAVAEARTEAARTVGQAREDAAATLAAARDSAQQEERETTDRLAAHLAAHEERRRWLQAEVEQLRAFERDYRTRLRAYLQMQLRELEEQSGQAGDGATAVAPHVAAPAAGSGFVSVSAPPPPGPGQEPPDDGSNAAGGGQEWEDRDRPSPPRLPDPPTLL